MNGNWVKIQIFSFNKIRLKMSTQSKFGSRSLVTTISANIVKLMVPGHQKHDDQHKIICVFFTFFGRWWFRNMFRGSEAYLTHWGRVTHICVSKLTIVASDNGLSPGRRLAIIRTNDGILWIQYLGTNFSEILSKTDTLKMWSAKWRNFVSASMC